MDTERRVGLPWKLTALFLLLLLAILVPFALYEEAMTRWAAGLVNADRPRVLVAAAVVSFLALDVVLPVPSTVVNTAAGALLGVWLGTLTAWMGLTAGCLLGYALGRSAGTGAAQRLVGEREWERVSQAAVRYGDWCIVLFRAVPVLAEASVLMAGMTRMPMGRFALLTTIANLGIAVVYAAIGALSARVESFLLAFAGATLLPLTALLLARIGRRAR